MRGIRQWVWRYRWWYAAGMLVLLVVDAVQTALPFIVRAAVDDLAAGHGGRLTALTLGMLAIALAMVVLRYLWRLYIIGAARRIRRDLRAELHLHLLRQDAGFHRGRTTGELVALCGNDLDAVAQACGFGLLALFDALFMAGFALAAMLHLDPRLAALACIPVPVIALVQWRLGRALHQRFDEVQASFAELTEQVREAVTGIRTVKAHAREAGLERHLARAGERNLAANLRLARVGALFDPAISLFAGAAMTIVIYAGGSLAVAGQISLGDLVAFIALLGLMSWPMVAIGWSINLLTRGSASMIRIADALRATPAIADPAVPLPLPEDNRLSLTGVGVRYPGSAHDALSGVSVEVPAGAVLGLVGGTGSGKSTLAQVLVRLVDPTAGEVRLGGTRIRDLRLGDLRRAVALVPQEATVFALSVHDNIAFARPDADAAAVEAAARAVGLHDEVMALPAGYATMLGERGVNLSGGQRQRVAIARAILAAPRLLVLDDCLSALDAATSALVLANLRASRAGLTTVVISHRLRTLADAQEILVLERGRVGERGTHASLIAGHGFYARLHALQQAERVVEERA